MQIVSGASMVHVAWSQFYPLIGLLTIIPAFKAFRFARIFLGRF